MDNRIVAAIAVLVMGAVCLAPIVSDDVSAENHEERISEMYVAKAEFTIDVILSTRSSYDLYMIEGSANHKAIEAYLKDPQNASYDMKDDFNDLRNHMGEKVWVYEYRPFTIDNIAYGSEWARSTAMLSPYNLEKVIVGNPHDVAKLKVNSLIGNEGREFDDYYFYKNEDYSWNTTGTTMSFEIEADTEYRITTRNGDSLYYTIEFDLDVSTPNGSPNAFAAICIAISILTISLLVAAALKPKWSK